MQLDALPRVRCRDEQKVIEVPSPALSWSRRRTLLGDKLLKEAAQRGQWQPTTAEFDEEHAPRLQRSHGTHLAERKHLRQLISRYAELREVVVEADGVQVVVADRPVELV